jgi:hypothetical protein
MGGGVRARALPGLAFALRASVVGLAVAGAVAAVGLSAGCTSGGAPAQTPGLAPRGTVMTTVKPTRQDITNRVSLSGKITLDPVFGLVAPVAGQVRYLTVTPQTGTPTKATRVAAVYVGNTAHYVEVPAGSTFAGRLVDDRSTVAAGTPIVSAKFAGYGLVADIDGGSAYQISDGLAEVQAQVKNGPGPFPCAVLGTIAALPAGTVPRPPAPPLTVPSGAPGAVPPGVSQQDRGSDQQQSEATGMRVVCTAPKDVKLINGADVTLAVVTAKASNVLVLPVEAVAGSQGHGKVDVVGPDQTRQTRDVELGLTDGRMVEIRSGLTGDETIAVPGPNLPAAPARQPDNGLGFTQGAK